MLRESKFQGEASSKDANQSFESFGFGRNKHLAAEVIP